MDNNDNRFCYKPPNRRGFTKEEQQQIKGVLILFCALEKAKHLGVQCFLHTTSKNRGVLNYYTYQELKDYVSGYFQIRIKTDKLLKEALNLANTELLRGKKYEH